MQIRQLVRRATSAGMQVRQVRRPIGWADAPQQLVLVNGELMTVQVAGRVLRQEVKGGSEREHSTR